MKLKVLLLAVIALIVLPGLASGLGVMPAQNTMVLDGEDKEYVLRVVNSEKKDFSVSVSVDGSLADLVSLSTERITFSENDAHRDVRVKVSAPTRDLQEGSHDLRIRLTSVEARGGDVSAKLGVSAKLELVVPYSNAFIDVKLFAPNFDGDKKGNFIVQAENRGSRNAVEVIPVIDIYSAGERIHTITGGAKRVDAGSSTDFVLPIGGDLPSGNYFARASVVYSGSSNVDEKSFTVGAPKIFVDSVSSTDFRLGGVAGFDLLLRSEWSQEIRNVYASVEFEQNGNLLHEARSSSVNIPGFGRSVVPVYWDTSGLGPGRYDMLVNLHYLDRVGSEEFEVILEMDRARVVGVGYVVSPGQEGDGVSVLLIVVLLIGLANLVLLYWFVIKKKK